MFDDFLYQLVSGSLPSKGCHFNAIDHYKPWEKCRTEITRHKAHGRVQLHIDLTCMHRLEHSTLLLNSKAPEQMTVECWRWRLRWNRLPSSTICFGCSACLQFLSSVLCRTAYSPRSPQDRLGGTHAKGAGHPDKLTVHGWRWYYAECLGGVCQQKCDINAISDERLHSSLLKYWPWTARHMSSA